MGSGIRDVLVVGAGPAGSRVARDLAMAGLDVAILEEHREVGQPCHCSGLVSPRTLEMADVGHGLVLNSIRGARVHAAGRCPINLGGARTHGYVIDRVDLDRRLAQQAVDAGAELIRPARFLRYELSGETGSGTASGHARVIVLRDGNEHELRCRLLVGADGAFSKVAQQVRGTRAKGMVAGMGSHAEYEANPDSDRVELFLDPDAAPGWFGWTIPLGDGTARLGTGSANGLMPQESFERLRSRYPGTFGTARIHTRSGGMIALWEPTPMVADRVMLVGDAARQVKPTSGGGIHAALQGASLAARHGAAAFHGPSLSARALATYPREWDRTMGRELRRQHDIRRMLQGLDPARIHLLMDLLERESLREEVIAATDIDFPAPGLRRLALRHPLVAARLLSWPRFPAAWLRT
jgi:digeranylgeranylglycerophospholipid reductase